MPINTREPEVAQKRQVTAILGLPILQHGHGSKKSVRSSKRTTHKFFKILLDSGSDGDLYFVQEGSKPRTTVRRRVTAQRWRTSNGTFHTKKVAMLNLSLPEYSSSKIFHVEADIVEVPKHESPAYDVIIGVETMCKMGIVLDFDKGVITIDGTALPMRAIQDLKDPRLVMSIYLESLEPTATREATKRAVKILDANYEKANLPEVVASNCDHLTKDHQAELLKLLQNFEELFDGTLGDWKTEPVHLELKPDAKPYHGKAFPVPFIHKETLRKEVERLVDIGVLARQPDSPWASPTFIIPKKNLTVRFISDFRKVNELLVRKPFPIPKISTVLQEMQGFNFASALDLNMGYYTLRLDADSQKICTIILPWGKYSYLRLPMGVAGSPDIFQEKMSALMEQLEYVRTYLDDLLVLTKGTYQDHLDKLRVVLDRGC